VVIARHEAEVFNRDTEWSVRAVSAESVPVDVGYGVRTAQANRESDTAFIGCKDGTVTRIVDIGQKKVVDIAETRTGTRFFQKVRHPNRAISAICPLSRTELLVGCADGAVEAWQFPTEDPHMDEADDYCRRELQPACVTTALEERATGRVSMIGRLFSQRRAHYVLVAWRHRPAVVYCIARDASGAIASRQRWQEETVGGTRFADALTARAVAGAAGRWIVVGATGRIGSLCRLPKSKWVMDEHSSDLYRGGTPPIMVWDYAGGHLDAPDDRWDAGYDTLILATDAGIWWLDLRAKDPLAAPLHLPGFAGTCNAIALQPTKSKAHHWVLFANDEGARAHIFTTGEIWPSATRRGPGLPPLWNARGTTAEHGMYVVRALGFPSARGITVVLGGHNSAARVMRYHVD
jgi:hypothetical protein